MARKRANQPGYKRSQGADGRTIWVPDDSDKKVSHNSITSLNDDFSHDDVEPDLDDWGEDDYQEDDLDDILKDFNDFDNIDIDDDDAFESMYGERYDDLYR